MQDKVLKRGPTNQPVPQELFGLKGPVLRLVFPPPNAGCPDATQVHSPLHLAGCILHHNAVPAHNLCHDPTKLVAQLRACNCTIYVREVCRQL